MGLHSDNGAGNGIYNVAAKGSDNGALDGGGDRLLNLFGVVIGIGAFRVGNVELQVVVVLSSLHLAR